MTEEDIFDIPEDDTDLPFDQFVDKCSKSPPLPTPALFRMQIFCNIQRFNLKHITSSVTLKPYNSIMLLLAFYSRVYARLQLAEELGTHVKARNRVGGFFDPLQDPEGPLLGIREILAFCEDFEVVLSRRKLQRLWLSMHGDWAKKIGLREFMQLLCVISDLCFDNEETKLQKVQRFVRQYGLLDFRILRSKLFDIYRDKYIYMYSEYENFTSILKCIDVKSVPSSQIEPLKIPGIETYSQGLKYLETLIYVNPDAIWEKYENASALDFGILKTHAKHEYKIEILNACHFLLALDVEVDSVCGIDPLEIIWNGFKRLSPGNSLTLRISIDTELVTSWFGILKIIAKSAAGEVETYPIPCFCRVSDEIASSHLPSLGISPFSSRIPSAQIARFDPAKTDNLRSRRPGSAFTSRPLSATVNNNVTVQVNSRRPQSSIAPRTASISRPASGAPRRPSTATNRN
jgi:hypothetical protein